MTAQWRITIPMLRNGFLVLLAMLVPITACSQNVIVIPGSPSGVALAPLEYQIVPIRVSHHAAVPISNTEVDTILQLSTRIAQERDSQEDVACPVAFVRSTPVREFRDPSLPPIIATPDEYDAIMYGDAANVKVVAGMNWCGRTFRPNVLAGCTPAYGPGIAVAADSIPGHSSTEEDWLNSILWLHEFGHQFGLLHRQNTHAVMHPYIEPSHTQFTAEECRR